MVDLNNIVLQIVESLINFINTMSKRLDNMTPTDTAKRLLKGQLFKLANTIIIPISNSNSTKTSRAKKD